jgi:hypothetical protein
MIYLYAPPSRSLPHTNVLVYEGTLSRNEGYVSTCITNMEDILMPIPG